MFQGFSARTNDFMWGITLNNNREWFLSQKEIYTKDVYTPLKALAYDVQDAMERLYPEECFNCKVTRIYRDARIPHANGPYKTHLWFILAPPADPEIRKTRPGLFFEIEGGSYSIGLDFYCEKPYVMEAFRKKAMANPSALESLTLYLQDRPDYKIIGPEYKRSRGEVGPLLQPWFNRKRFCVMTTHDWDDSLYESDFCNVVTEAFQWLMPIYHYLLDIDP